MKSKKLNLFGFFMLLSFLFLVVAKLSKTYTEVIPFYVKYTNVPPQHSIAPSYDSIVKVSVTAYGFNLLSHNFYKHSLTVDFENEVHKRDSVYVWNTDNGITRIGSQFGPSITVLSVQPDSVVFPYETMAVKTVPVQMNAEITYASGYDSLDGPTMQPDSVNVIGPENMVMDIQKIQTKLIKLTNVNHSIKSKVELILPDSLKSVKLEQSSVILTDKVEKFTEGTFEVPVNIVNLPPKININYFPKTISVSYYVSLENYKHIKALDFRVVCDYNDVKARDRSFFSPQLVSMPKNVKNAKMKQNKVEFIILQ